ncbi:MAG TPA: phosphodiester glycosidase family protein [Allocoleopsis sp.]
MRNRVTPVTGIRNGKIGAIAFKSLGISVLLNLVGSSSGMANVRMELAYSRLFQMGRAMLEQLPATDENAIAESQIDLASQASSPVIQHQPHTRLGEALIEQRPEIAQTTIVPRRAELLTQVSPQLIRQGTQVSLNGQALTIAWRQWQQGGSIRTGISDVSLMQRLGLDLLSTRDLTRQPIGWFSNPASTPLILATQLSGAYRYLDVTDFAKLAGWQLQAEGNTLHISSQPAKVLNVRQEQQPWGDRIIVDLDRPTPWQASDRSTEGVITLEASTDPSLIERLRPAQPEPAPEQLREEEGSTSVPAGSRGERATLQGESTQNRTTFRITIPAGKRLQVSSLPNPNRLVIDIGPNSLVEKEILWAPGMRWHQQYLNLGDSRFPVVWLDVDPRNSGALFRPIWSNPTTQVGTAPLIQTSLLWQATAAINAGFFNRKNQLPLGAIRRDGRWYSGPILNRGAIAWNDRGQFKIGRLSLQETLITARGERLPVLFLNSGYIQPGLARYTPEWGTTYTPLTDNEVLFVVQNNQITSQLPGGASGQTSFPIPANGYILTLRSDGATAIPLSLGTSVRIEQNTTPSDFGQYPHILGAGPLLLQNRQIVLDAKSEQFSDAFARQSAIRSCIGRTATGSLILVAIHNRTGGLGPNLTETAQLMQKLGAIDALNFDGGSSTGLFLGGQLLDRSSYTAARVHNGLGIFRPPFPQYK